MYLVSMLFYRNTQCRIKEQGKWRHSKEHINMRRRSVVKRSVLPSSIYMLTVFSSLIYCMYCTKSLKMLRMPIDPILHRDHRKG